MSLEGMAQDASMFRFADDAPTGGPKGDLQLDSERGDKKETIHTGEWTIVGITTHNESGRYTTNNDAMALVEVDGGFWVVVADGVGENGGVAAETLTQRFTREIQTQGAYLGPYSDAYQALMLIKKAVLATEDAIVEPKTATVFALVTVIQGEADSDSIFEPKNNSLLVAWAGDASVEIVKKSRAGEMLIETVTISDTGATENIVTNAVGRNSDGNKVSGRKNQDTLPGQPLSNVHHVVIENTPDIVAIHVHSDGANKVSQAEVVKLISIHGAEAPEHIIKAAQARGERDNITSVVIIPKPKNIEQLT